MPTAKKKTFTRKADASKSPKKAVSNKKESMPDKTTPDKKDESMVVNGPSHWEEQKPSEATPGETSTPSEIPESPAPETPPAETHTSEAPAEDVHPDAPTTMTEEPHTVSVQSEMHPDTPAQVSSSTPEPAPTGTPATPETPTGPSFSALPQEPMNGMGDGNMATVVETKSKKGLFLGLVAILLLLVLGGAGYYLYAKYSKMQASDTTNQAPATAEVTPSDQTVASDSATPTPASSSATAVGKLKVRVLNGTATKGLAAKVASLLEDAGFKNITTGNADTTEATTTTVALGKDTDKSVFDTVKKALGSDYTVEQASSAAKTYDVDITVGK